MTNASSRRRVRVLYTGGLPVSERYTAEEAKNLLSGYLDLQFVADADVVVIDQIVGANVQWNLTERIAKAIDESYVAYDGFVVIHSMDNVVYTACLLQFFMVRLGKPIVFTGGPLGGDQQELPEEMANLEDQVFQKMGLRTNLISAVQLASIPWSGVALAFGPLAVRAIRALEHNTAEGLKFTSFDEPPLANIQFGVQVGSHAPRFSKKSLQLNLAYDDAVTVLDVHMAENNTELQYPKQTKVLLLRGYHQQALPAGLQLPEDIPVLISTHSTIPFDQPNVQIVNTASFPTALTKSMITLPKVGSIKEFFEVFYQPLHDEFIEL